VTARVPRPHLHRTTVFRPRQPAFWAFALILLPTGLVTLGGQQVLREMAPSGWALSWGLLLLYALPVLAVVYALDLYEREPVSMLVAAFAWGAIAATALSGIANEGWGLVVARVGGPEFASRWTAALTAPFVEETLKGAGVVLLYLIARGEIDDLMDGFVYGAIVGLGFAVVEDVIYFVAVFGGSPTQVLQGFFLRVIASGLYGHVLYTGLVGMGVAYVVSRREEVPLGRRMRVAAGLSAVAVLGHFLWNSPALDLFPEQPWTGAEWIGVPLAAAARGVPLLVFVAVIVRLARARERRWLRGALAAELGGAGISADELATLERPRLRREARRAMRVRAGRRAAAVLRRLQREQVNLAMVRSRVARDDDPALLAQRAYCASLRDALRAIPGAAPGEASR
jgi:RsiW-degrading membrane proteinase PrsW (M82 family)